MAKNLFTAIVFFGPGNAPHKYRNVSNRPAFAKFALSNKAYYINWYDKRTREFVGREWLRDFLPPSE